MFEKLLEVRVQVKYRYNRVSHVSDNVVYRMGLSNDT
jgi:hypothetical protein